jgi:outer membrane protein assembly factor BamB
MITINITQRKALYSRTVEDRSLSKFASVLGYDDNVYVGSTSGSVFVFASASGLFVKEIPF